MITDRDMRTQVIAALDGRDAEFDVYAIVEDIHERYGLIDVETVDHDVFWLIVGRHAIR